MTSVVYCFSIKLQIEYYFIKLAEPGTQCCDTVDCWRLVDRNGWRPVTNLNKKHPVLSQSTKNTQLSRNWLQFLRYLKWPPQCFSTCPPGTEMDLIVQISLLGLNNEHLTFCCYEYLGKNFLVNEPSHWMFKDLSQCLYYQVLHLRSSTSRRSRGRSVTVNLRAVWWWLL